MKRIIMLMALCTGLSGLALTITDVTAQQRYPWNGLVDIVVTFSGASNDVAQATCVFLATNSATQAALAVKSVTETGTGPVTVGTDPEIWTRRFVWDATADVGEVKIGDVVITVELALGGVQLWKDGPYWAECNVGASNPEESGYYFWWGDTVGYQRVGDNWNAVDGSMASFSFESGNCPTYGQDASSLQALGYLDATGKLAVAHDAATAHLGTPWRMPTSAEVDALILNCTTTWITTNGVAGRLVTGKGDYASKSIFIPVAGRGDGSGLYLTGSYGHYWSSTPYLDDSNYNAMFIGFGSGYFRLASNPRYWGQSVRPLREVTQNTATSSLTVHLSLDCRTGTRVTARTETIAYSSTWDAVAEGAKAVVAANGATISAQAGTGSVVWTPKHNGSYTLTHTVTTNGVQVGETLSATFVVEGLNPENPVITPESGTVFDSSLSITMSCPSEGATIHYTLDGSEPTVDSPVYKRFRISGKTTVKARAFDENEASEVVTAEYALGRCDDPVVSQEDGTVFKHAGLEVSITKGNEGVLRYTLDGSEPTAASPEYTGPFTVSKSTTVKTKVFSDKFFDSQVVTINLVREWETVEPPVVTAATTFSGTKTRVELSCATPSATIRYTLNGRDPNAHSTAYTQPFYVTDGCTIKAYAALYDYSDSDVVTQIITKVWDIGNTLGMPDHAFTTGGDAGFVRVEDATAPLGESMKSGAISNSEVSTLESKFMGSGKLSFRWKTSCEYDEEQHAWDHAELLIDGTEILRLDGVTNWVSVSRTLRGTNEHVVVWRYVKDEVEKDGEDCLWLADVVWQSNYTATQTTAIPVPYAWLAANCSGVVDEYASYEYFANQTAVNPRYSVQDCYVAGLDPEDPKSDLKMSVEMRDGVPYLDWSPYLNTNGAERLYRVWGRDSLESGEWERPVKESHHFFKVDVSLPVEGEESDGPGSVSSVPHPHTQLYMVIDLSAGTSGTNYPVSYLDSVPKEGWSDVYKTTKLVLRRIEAGSFIMGQEADASHQVTLSKPFYMGIFEITQKQWELVTGYRPSTATYDMHPSTFSYSEIRGNTEGARWPQTSTVDASSFLGILRSRTGLCFDLPTEAQWEFAYHAGTSTSYYWGSSMDTNYIYTWYDAKSKYTVGICQPNAWELYDMSGNVSERCLDWYGELTYGIDPVGAQTGTRRICRGGCYWTNFLTYTYYYRECDDTAGGRIAYTVQ